MNNNHDHRDILGPKKKEVNIRIEFFLNINLTNNLNECTFKIFYFSYHSGHVLWNFGPNFILSLLSSLALKLSTLETHKSFVTKKCIFVINNLHKC